MMWTEGGQINHLAFAGLRGGGKGGSSNASGTNYSSSTNTTTLPDWVTSASQGALQNAQAIAGTPYSPYGGQLVAGTPQATQQAYQQIAAMQGMTNPAFAQANQIYGGLTSGAQLLTPAQQNAQTNALYGNFQQGVYNPAAQLYGQSYGNAAGLLGQYAAQGPATAQQVGSNAMQLMSPYEAAVINPSLQIGEQQLMQNLQGIGANANQAGAFGGSRQGVMEGVAQSQAALGAMQQIGSMLNTGWQTAMPAATNVALQGAQQGYGAAGTLAGMGSSDAQALAGLLQQGYGTAGQQAQAMGQTNLQAGLTATQGLTQDALAQAQEAQKEASLMQTVGAAQQNQQQNILNSQYGQYLYGQQYPTQNLDVLLSTLGAIPYGTTTSGTSMTYGNQQNTTTPSPASTLGNVAGGALSGGLSFGPIGAVAGGILGALAVVLALFPHIEAFLG